MSELTKDQKKLQDMLREKKYQNCLLQHSKTKNYYFVVARVFHSETGEEMLAYVELYGDHKIWVRPIGMFKDDVVINGTTVKRFVKAINDPKALDTLKEFLEVAKRTCGTKIVEI